MENSRTFRCSCGNDLEMEYPSFKEHLETIHSLDPSKSKGLKTMVMHMDHSKYFSSTYEWTLDAGLKFFEYVMCARVKTKKI